MKSPPWKCTHGRVHSHRDRNYVLKRHVAVNNNNVSSEKVTTGTHMHTIALVVASPTIHREDSLSFCLELLRDLPQPYSSP